MVSNMLQQGSLICVTALCEGTWHIIIAVTGSTYVNGCKRRRYTKLLNTG